MNISKQIVELYNDNKVILLNPLKSTWLKMPIDLYNRVKSGDIKAQEKMEGYFCKYLMLEESGDNNGENGYDKIPFSVYIFLTRKCNLECSFCSMKSSPLFKEENFPFEEWKNVIDQLKEYKVKRIILTGGEPTLFSEIERLVDYIKSKMDCEIILSTNGVLFTSQLIEMIASSISRVDISWESIYGEYPQLQTQLRCNVRRLIDRGANVHLSYVMTKENKKYVHCFLEDALKYGVEIDLKVVSPIVNGKEYENILLEEKELLKSYLDILYYVNSMDLSDEQLSKLKSLISQTPKPSLACGGGTKGIVAIYPNGEVYPCHSVAREEYLLGNLKKESLKESLERYNCDISEIFRVDSQKYCQKCSIRYLCQGQCAGEIMNLKDTNQKPVQCELKKILINYYLWEYKPGKTVKDIFLDIEERVRFRLIELEEDNGKNCID